MKKEQGQIQIVIIGLLVVGAFLALNFFGVFGGKKDDNGKEAVPSEGQPAVTSSVGPQRSNLYPTGTLPAGTKETTISVSTDREAYCRYDKTPGTFYNSMSGAFSYNKEKTFHSIKAVGLESGKTYEYYVRCRDMDNNKNAEDAVIRFSVGSSYAIGGATGGSSSGGSVGSGAIPPVISNLYPTGTLPAGTMETELSVSTNEAAYCRYSTTAGTTYNSMTKSFNYDKAKLVHTVNIVGLADNKIYEYYVRCRDLEGNRNTSDVIIRFGVGGVNYSPATNQNQDITPPYRYDGYPDEDMPYTTKSTLISLKTDEKAVCRYDSVSGMSYGQMRAFDNTNGFTHSTQVSGFNEGETYKYYVKCSDGINNSNTDDYLISFKVEVPDDVTPPVITVLYPYADLYYGTTETQLSVSTNESATCRYSTEGGVAYGSMKKNFTKQEANIHTAKVTGLVNGVYYAYYVRCKDAEGNVNTGDIMIRFRVTP